MTEKQCGIYKIEIGCYIYIGQSIDILNRIKQHKNKLKRNSHCNKFMQNVFNKYKTFESEILIKCSKEYLVEYEDICINSYDQNFVLNIMPASWSLPRTKEWKEKMSVIHKTSIKAIEARKIVNKKRLGTKLCKKSYENVVAANKLRIGQGHSELTKAKMSNTRQNSLELKEACRQMGLKYSGENNANYISQQYIFYNERTQDTFTGSRHSFRKYLQKPQSCNGNLSHFINCKHKTFFGYTLVACMLPS